MDKDTDLLPPLLIAGILALAFMVVSSLDYAWALTDEAVKKDPPRILSYTIKQDSPGLRTAHDVLPLDMPVAAEYVRAKKHRHSTKEKR